MRSTVIGKFILAVCGLALFIPVLIADTAGPSLRLQEQDMAGDWEVYDVTIKDSGVGMNLTDSSPSRALVSNSASKWDKAVHASADLDNLFAAIASSTDIDRDWLGDWASMYVASLADLGPEMAKQTAVAVLGGFGEGYAPDSSEIFAFKTRDTASFTQAHTREGNAAAISDLELWRSPRMESRLQSDGGASDIEAYVYAARFGSGPSHVGTALARTHWAGTEIVFLPLAMVKVTGLFANDAAAFLADQLDGKGGFTDFVRNRHGKEPVAVQAAMDSPIKRATRWGCDYRALSACAAEILDTLESELEAAREAHDQAIDEIMHQYGEVSVEALMEWILAGVIPGVLAGGAVGGPMGAFVFGFFGALGGVIAAITGTANNADEIQEALDAADADYADAICQAKAQAIISLIECIREHCPDAADKAEQWAEQQFELEGCIWD